MPRHQLRQKDARAGRIETERDGKTRRGHDRRVNARSVLRLQRRPQVYCCRGRGVGHRGSKLGPARLARAPARETSGLSSSAATNRSRRRTTRRVVCISPARCPCWLWRALTGSNSLGSNLLTTHLTTSFAFCDRKTRGGGMCPAPDATVLSSQARYCRTSASASSLKELPLAKCLPVP
jgi:hypothetical protein